MNSQKKIAEIPFVTNYHTHTTFCDGTDCAQVVAETALKKGFAGLGFSSHAVYPYASLWHMSLERYAEYVGEVRHLEREYAGILQIFLGFEADYFPPLSSPKKSVYAAFSPDYLIGSVHFLTGERLESGCFTVDGPVKEVADGIRGIFAGNAQKAVQTYFAAQRDMVRSCDFDIVGHPDVIRKRNGELRFFDESEPWYKRELEETARVFAASGKIVEINTGGIARGMMSDVYPSADFLSFLFRSNVPVVINSDAHTAAGLDCAFNLAEAAVKKAGYREVAVLEKNSGLSVWKSRPL